MAHIAYSNDSVGSTPVASRNSSLTTVAVVASIGSHDPPGYEAGKKIRGKKRHILVDTPGLLMHAADIQDRDGGALVMATLFGMYPFLQKLYVDGGYQGLIF